VPPTISPTRRWYVFPLAKCCNDALAERVPDPKARALDYEPGSAPIRFTSDGDSLLYDAGGWLEPELWGTWASGTHSALRFRLDPRPSGPVAVDIETRMVLGPNVPRRVLTVHANGRAAGRFVYDAESGGSQNIHIELEGEAVDDDGVLELEFDVSPKASPASAGVSIDARQLGIGLVDMSIAPAAADGAR
jgi:hypothetical protein